MVETYIYIYTDPTSKGRFTYPGVDVCFLYEPFYVGKGREGRLFNHIKESKRRNKNSKHKKILDILHRGIDIKSFVFIYKCNLDDDSAYALEEELIAKIGRKVVNKGPLLNLAPGGKGNKYGHCSKLSLAEAAEIESLYTSGMKVDEIAIKFGVSTSTVHVCLQRNKVKMRAKMCSPALSSDQEILVVESYLEGESPAKLAKEFGVCGGTILDIVRRAGHTPRTRFGSTLSAYDNREYIKTKHKEGATIKSLAEEFSSTYKTITMLLNGETPKEVHNNLKLQSISQEVISMYEEGLSHRAISLKLKISKLRVRNIINELTQK